MFEIYFLVWDFVFCIKLIIVVISKWDYVLLKLMRVFLSLFLKGDFLVKVGVLRFWGVGCGEFSGFLFGGWSFRLLFNCVD